MFRAAVLLALAAAALALSTGDLEVSVSVVDSTVDSIDDIIISAVVKNPTNRDIRILRKNNILDTSATRSFAVKSESSSDVLFTGIRATYDLSNPSLYVTIPAGSSIAVNHTGLGPLYDFESSGTGKFEFAPNTLFQTGPDSEVLEVKTKSISVTVKKDVAQRHLAPLERRLDRRLSTINCGDGGRAQTLRDSLSYARSMSGGSTTDIGTHPNSVQFNDYFAGSSQAEIAWRFDLIAGDLASSGTRQIFCSADPAGICGGTGGVIAYTLLVTSGGQLVGSDIYTCEIFFTRGGTTPGMCQTGYESTLSSRGGIILHELSHATSLTNDVTYGCTACRGLSAANKRINADNYRCMGSAIYTTYNC